MSVEAPTLDENFILYVTDRYARVRSTSERKAIRVRRFFYPQTEEEPEISTEIRASRKWSLSFQGFNEHIRVLAPFENEQPSISDLKPTRDD